MSETDRDSTADSVGSKEDELNETPENDPNDTKNDIGSPDSGNLSNGKLTNGYGHNDPGESDHPHNGTPGENQSRHNDSPGENSRKSELDNESGCYDCETGKLCSPADENGPICKKCHLCNGGSSGDHVGLFGDHVGSSGDHVWMTNGYHSNGVDNNVSETKHCTCQKDGRRSLSSRLSSYSVSSLFMFVMLL